METDSMTREHPAPSISRESIVVIARLSWSDRPEDWPHRTETWPRKIKGWPWLCMTMNWTDRTRLLTQLKVSEILTKAGLAGLSVI